MSAKIPRFPTYHDGKENLDSHLKRYEKYALTSNWKKRVGQ